MSDTFFFYDLETSGINPRTARIMQFAGQRTDMNLKPIGEPVNVMIKLAPDSVPDPDAIMITGITPQATLQDGITEAEFVKMFLEEVATPGTIFTGFNTVRFDDEFMRCLMYRNFCDAYAWEWKDNRSRWDLLDVVRMTRALRPEGINWPTGPNGEVTNRLELLTHANGLDHQNAHDALNDVYATIAVAELIKKTQPKLFDYLLKLRNKQQVKELVRPGKTFVYTSGKYPKELQHTTVALMLAERPDGQGAFVYDLRHDPAPFLDKTPDQLAKAWQYSKDPDALRLPVKTLKYNRCPAVADLAVLQKDRTETLQRLQLDLPKAQTYAAQLTPAFIDKLYAALQILDKDRPAYDDAQDVDAQLYDGFMSGSDATLMPQLCAAGPKEISRFAESFHDKRLKEMVPLYKARNFPDSLSDEERTTWDKHCFERLLGGGEKSRMARYFARLGELAETADENKRFLLEELQLYGQAIMPIPDESGESEEEA
jgi:exodeoxyribonuclease-1